MRGRGGRVLHDPRWGTCVCSGLFMRGGVTMIDLKRVADDFAIHMTTKFGAKLIPKESAFEMEAIAYGMDLGRFAGMTGLSSREDFMKLITTTIGTNIYMAAQHRNDPLSLIEVLTHECQHVLQFKESGINFAWLYLAEGEARVKYEVDAYAAGVAMHRWLTGGVPEGTIAGTVNSLANVYHLRQADLDLAEKMLQSHMASLKAGVVMSASAREGIDFLTRHYPELQGKV